jgi:hypothetical protein
VSQNAPVPIVNKIYGDKFRKANYSSTSARGSAEQIFDSTASPDSMRDDLGGEMYRHRALGCVLSVFLFIWAGSALAQNIVPNNNFDTQLPPWAQFLSSAPDPIGAGATPIWQAVDSGSSPSSGSALVDIDTTTPAGDAASGIAQCVDFATPSTIVTLVNYGISFRVPAATTADGSVNATVEVRLFSGTGCSGFLTGGSQGRTIVAGLASDTTWYAVGDNGFVPPGGSVTASSAQIRAYLREVNGVAPSTTDYKANFDAARLVLNSSTPVRLQQFDVE